VNSCDVAVVGGGPAGACAALALARAGVAVMLLETSHHQHARIGETLPPAALPVLARMGLDGAVAELAPLPSYGNVSVWGAAEPATLSFVFSPHGHGWHLDRRRFDALLVDAAARAGAAVLRDRRVEVCAPTRDESWTVVAGGESLRARALVDASGRAARLAQRLGAHRDIDDRLVGVAVRLAGPAQDVGHTLVEADADGWWYSAPLPQGGMIAAYMTDADLCAARHLNEPRAWSRRLAGTVQTRERLRGYEPVTRPQISAAISHRLRRRDGRSRWLAAGDAALAVDPLTSSGILRALLSGEAAGLATAHRLLGREQPSAEYERWLDEQHATYCRERKAVYALETRWPEAPFWRRRTGQ
jgi:flavin-dependent dehydrogenase